MKLPYGSLLGASLVVLSFAAHAQIAGAQDFPGCTLPFEAIKETHSIDSSCGPEGKTSNDANRLQNNAKNNFCATGSPVTVTFNSFAKLQQAAEDHHVGSRLPDDRSVLKDIYTTPSGKKIGEGTIVRFVAFIVDAHNSNVSKGESVNCKLHGKENNDIHIMLGASSSASPCTTVTAEMSPHFRPAAWDQIVEINLRHPARITGQLFFDASHKPCKGGKGPNPKRASLWEIHPVYMIDVCDGSTLAVCTIGDESLWTSLDQWLATGEGEGMTQSHRPTIDRATAASAKESLVVKSGGTKADLAAQ